MRRAATSPGTKIGATSPETKIRATSPGTKIGTTSAGTKIGATRRKPVAFDADPSRSIGYLIRDTSRLILAKLQLRLVEHDVTLSQYFVLRELWQQEGLTQRELSERIAIQEQSTVATIDAMEKRDLVVRVRSTQDRRKIHIHLTERGRGLRKPLLGYAAGVINGATGDFSAAELEALRASLRKLKRNLERT